MKIDRLTIQNFRGISSAHLLFPDHVVLIGDNNTGKSTVLEAINLVLGPDRIGRRVPIDEHDFYKGRYLADESVASVAKGSARNVDEDEATGNSENSSEEKENKINGQDETDDVPVPPQIRIEATVTDLSDEQRARFMDYIEWWNREEDEFYTKTSVEGVDSENIVEAIRVLFIGHYVVDEDDFDGKTFFARSFEESENPQSFSRKDKQYCGFIYLRGLRTGRRALSLEHGSLLDIIFRLKEIRPQMWESTISGLASFDVANDPDLHITGVLNSINAELKKYVPKEWGIKPYLRISSLTRNHLRDIVTAFIPTGEGSHSAPYYRQGAGTINMLVLAMLSQVAEEKQNVIFALKEPETAIPPYAQKRIVHELRKLSAQSIFTSHSPYVLEEFDPSEAVVLSRSDDGCLSQATISLPPSVKHKRYRQEFPHTILRRFAITSHSNH